MHSHRTTQFRTLIAMLRSIAVLAVLFCGWYIASSFRTQRIGFSFSSLFVSAIFVIPLALIPFIGCRQQVWKAGSIAMLLITLGTAEAFATLEENIFIKRSQSIRENAALVSQDRNWPFKNHSMLYDPKTGQASGTD